MLHLEVLILIAVLREPQGESQFGSRAVSSLDTACGQNSTIGGQRCVRPWNWNALENATHYNNNI